MKNLNFLLIATFSLLLLSASDCNRKDFKYIYIKNLSEKKIYYLPSYSYPDTVIKEITPEPVEPKSESVYGPGSGGFDLNNTLIFFIFDADTVETLPWDTIVKNYNILKRYEVTKQDMENSNWTITYP